MVEIKHFVVLLRKQNGIYFRHETIRCLKEIVSVKGLTFKVNRNCANYVSRNNIYHYLDIDTGEQLAFEKSAAIDPHTLDTLVGSHIVEQITRSVRDRSAIFPIIPFVMGILAGISTVMIVLKILEYR